MRVLRTDSMKGIGPQRSTWASRGTSTASRLIRLSVVVSEAEGSPKFSYRWCRVADGGSLVYTLL